MLKVEKIKDGLNIHGISLITSCGCNLQCKYCNINKSLNSAQSQLQQNTIQALKDGTFLNNIRECFLKLNISPDQIYTLSFWGQEPTLTLNYITDHLDDWLEYFFNVDYFIFVTNGQDGAQKIIDFLITLDKTLKHDCSISIQFSYDGWEQTELSRGASPQKIHDTLEKILNTLNNYTFIHLTKVEMHLHGVLSMELVKRLDTVEKMYNYYNEYEEFAIKLANLNRNKIIDIRPEFSMALETPVDATAEDGFRYANFYKQSMMLTNLKGTQNRFVTGVSNNFRMTFSTLNSFPYETISDFLNEWSTNNENFVNMIHNLSMHMFCGTNSCEYKFLYDGTIVNCQNCIYDTDLEHLQEKTDSEAIIKKQLVKHKFFVNPLKDSQEDIDKMRDMFSIMHTESFLLEFCQASMMIYLLALAHQVNEDYLVDHNKLMRHAFELAISFGCFYNNVVKTGSVYLKNAGLFRLCCNGLLDEIEKTGFFELQGRKIVVENNQEKYIDLEE